MSRPLAHWEHGHRCHGLWIEVTPLGAPQRLQSEQIGFVGIGPQGLWRPKQGYHALVRGHHRTEDADRHEHPEEEQTFSSLRQAKRWVEERCAALGCGALAAAKGAHPDPESPKAVPSQAEAIALVRIGRGKSPDPDALAVCERAGWARVEDTRVTRTRAGQAALRQAVTAGVVPSDWQAKCLRCVRQRGPCMVSELETRIDHDGGT